MKKRQPPKGEIIAPPLTFGESMTYWGQISLTGINAISLKDLYRALSDVQAGIRKAQLTAGYASKRG